MQDDVVKAAEEWLFDGHGRRSLSVMIFGGPGAGAGAGGEGKGHVAEMEPYMQGADSRLGAGAAVEPDGPFFGPTVTKVGVDGLQTLRDALPLFTPGPVDSSGSGSGSDGTAASLTIR